MAQLRFVFLGLSITSSWGNGHATTYRGLLRELAARGHDVMFLERNAPWYAENRDLPEPPYGSTHIYDSITELKDRFQSDIRAADVVVVGSYVPEGVAVGEWVTATARGATAFYDIDTPVTMAKLARGDYEYLTPELIARYQLYLSFTGGPTLRRIEREYGSPRARVLYCSVDPALYFTERWPIKWDLGYIGTYGADRQPALDALLCEPARQWPEGRFIVAGPMYPRRISWPRNVRRRNHLSPSKHRAFYNSQRFTLNVTRADMVRAGYSPSVRLFEAAACGVPIISDYWDGLETILRPGAEVLVARDSAESLAYLREISEDQRLAIGENARRRVLGAHTAAHRAAEFERYVNEDAGAGRKAERVRVSMSGVGLHG
jgi:spore maturation protein CgeB